MSDFFTVSLSIGWPTKRTEPVHIRASSVQFVRRAEGMPETVVGLTGLGQFHVVETVEDVLRLIAGAERK